MAVAQMVIFIISGGSISDSDILHRWLDKEPDAVVVCADGGSRYAEAAGIVPYAVIGDMDSVDERLISSFEEQGSTIIRHFPEKDETDTELALRYALSLRPKRIFLFGALGARWDHSLANILLLAGAVPADVDLRIIDDSCEIFLVTRKISVRGKTGQTISILPLSPVVTGVTLRGFEYPLSDAEIKMGSSLGISNRLTGTEGFVEVKSGRLMVISNSVL